MQKVFLNFNSFILVQLSGIIYAFAKTDESWNVQNLCESIPDKLVKVSDLPEIQRNMVPKKL